MAISKTLLLSLMCVTLLLPLIWILYRRILRRKHDRKQKYKLLIIGAWGSGKSTFLGSYFYSTVCRGLHKKYPITINENSVRNVHSLVRNLFEKAVCGTDTFNDMSFRAGSMEVELFDLPGGYTTDVEYWANGVCEKLEDADGALFFISADDVVHNYPYFIATVPPFSLAIQKLRAPKEGQNARKDVPIYFLFTKGDLIRNERDENGQPYTVEKLWEMTGEGLRKCAQSGGSRLHRKGRFDKSFLVTSLGDWPDAETPPKQSDYSPINVVEPMEQMFTDMRASNSVLTRFS